MTAHAIDIDAASIAAAKRAELDALEAELAELTTRRDVLARETEAYERFAAEIAAIRSPGPTKPAAKSKAAPATKPAAKATAAPKSSTPRPGAGDRIIDRAVEALRKAGRALSAQQIIAAMKYTGSSDSVAVTLKHYAKRGEYVRRDVLAGTFELLPGTAPRDRGTQAAPGAATRTDDRGCGPSGAGDAPRRAPVHKVRSQARPAGEFRDGAVRGPGRGGLMQLDLPIGARRLPPANRTDTSLAAARSIAEIAPTLQEQVVAYVRRCPNGATNEEISEALGMRLQTTCARAAELHDAGLIEDSGQRRPGKSGRLAKVWRATR